MNEEWMIDVAGVSAGGWQAETEELVRRAELIVAGQRILDMITRGDVEKIPLDASALRNLERILAQAKGEADALSGFGRSALQRDRRHSAPSSAGKTPADSSESDRVSGTFCETGGSVGECGFVQRAWKKSSALAENPRFKTGRDLLRCGIFRESDCR